jgi:hypothetical protein
MGWLSGATTIAAVLTLVMRQPVGRCAAGVKMLSRYRALVLHIMSRRQGFVEQAGSPLEIDAFITLHAQV